LRVNLEDLPAPVSVRAVDDDLPVEPPRAEQRRVEDVRPVRRRDQDDVVLQLEPVHLDEELVQGLLALVVAAAEPRAAVASGGVSIAHHCYPPTPFELKSMLRSCIRFWIWCSSWSEA